MRYKDFYRLGKIGFATVIWFFSSLIVGPIYLGLLPLIRPKTELLYGILVFGGAIAWYVIVYIIVSILFRIILRRMNRTSRHEPNE